MKCTSCNIDCEESQDGQCWFCRMDDSSTPDVVEDDESTVKMDGTCGLCGKPTRRFTNGNYARFCGRKCTMKASQKRKREGLK